MKGYSANIEEATLVNSNFRTVVYTAKFCFEKGEGRVIIEKLRP